MLRGPWNLPVTYAAKVTVKRVFRGEGRNLEGREVVVEGLGNRKICVSRPKIGDTRDQCYGSNFSAIFPNFFAVFCLSKKSAVSVVHLN
jgi:hypothetical protein